MEKNKLKNAVEIGLTILVVAFAFITALIG